MEQTELKERRYVGVRETLIYGVANGGQVIGYNLVRMQLTFFLVTVFGIPGHYVVIMLVVEAIVGYILKGVLFIYIIFGIGRIVTHNIFNPHI